MRPVNLARDLADIRERESLAVRAQQLADRYDLVRRVRRERDLGIRYTAAPARRVA